MSKLQLLVPMDGTEFSRRIEPQVRKLFPPDRWGLKLLHVARVPVDPGTAAYQPAAVGPDYRLYMYGYELPGTDLHPLYDEDRLEDFRQSLEHDLQNEVKLFEEFGYDVSAAVNFGEPADAIVSYAEETGVDVVAMATHHRKGFERLIHGSVARRALNRLAVPALLLRVDDDDKDRDDRGKVPSDRVENTTAENRSATDSAAADGVAANSRRGSAGREAGEGRADPGARMPAPAGKESVLKDDQVVTPAETSPAVLAGLSGRGVLTVIWNAEGKVAGTEGSWFPDSPDDDLSRLEEAARYNRPVIFEGRSMNAETAGHDEEVGEQVRREVTVTSVRSYQDYGGDTHRLVSFELADALDMTDVPEQYTRSEFDQLDLSEVADITGLQPQQGMTPEQESEFREQAWKSYRLDIEHRDEWGTARQNTALPHGE